ncbi:DUF2306 domain-containing protein [Streptomyces sp. NPDC020681]|uniref:DUF2306 domain-containing protein n=1 Tax=Streptomyces sp. NPDC020681 TaxID=3365083 RepID=UPI0037B1DB4B
MTFSVSRMGRRRIAWAAVAVSAVGTAVFSGANYLTGDASASRIPLNPVVAAHYLTIVVHALPACLLLLVGPFQFATRLQARRPRLHRTLGYVYMTSVVVAAIAALLATTFSVDGISVQAGFYLLSAAWLYTLFQGFRAIRQGQIQLHRLWLIRNYALSFAAVALRAFLGLGVALQGPFPSLAFDDIYTTSVWASILVSAGVAEYFIIHRTVAPLLRRRTGKPMRSANPTDMVVASRDTHNGRQS